MATKEELIERYRDINTRCENWWTDVYAEFVSACRVASLPVEKDTIAFTGFWSQGDGASFTTTYPARLITLLDGAQAWLDPTQAIREVVNPRIVAALDTYAKDMVETFLPMRLSRSLVDLMEWCRLRVYRTSGPHYVHSGTMSVEAEGIEASDRDQCGVVEAPDALHPEALEHQFRDHMRSLADTLYRVLEEEHESLNSDEAVWDTIEANGLDHELDEAVETIEATPNED
jgi:hypothetical protein